MTQDSIVWGIYRHIFPLCAFICSYFGKMQVWYKYIPMHYIGGSKTKIDFPMVPIVISFHEKI